MCLSRLLACLSTAGLLLTTAPTTAPAAAEPRTVPSASGSTTAHRLPGRVPTEHRVTLITGDKVVVRSQPGRPDEVRFQPGRGSGSTAATIVRGNGHVRVVPAGAHADLVAGRLDPALFDISTLIANGYDDARSAVLPAIVEYAGSTAPARRAAAEDRLAGARRVRLLTSIGARGAVVGKATATQFWQSVTSRARVDAGIRRIRLDRRVRASLDRSVAQIGGPAAWQRGLTGKGVQVAVLDTGIDAGHPDLTGKVAVSANFSESPDTTDRVGHGTHVAGTVAGTGAASAGSYRGVAPDAMLLNGKVLGDDGFGSWSGVIAGMEWAVAQGADVVNLSLGGDPTDGTDPVAEAVNTLTRSSGTLFVVAAGNCFSTAPQQVSSPASADLALAVANLERDGSLAESSCRGPRAGDRSLKPEIAAPGSGIVAPRASGTDPGEPVGEHYTTLTGTSMATPHVAGVAALLRQQRALNAEQLKTRLMTTADPQDGASVTGSGAGRVDADQATAGTVSAGTAEVDLGTLRWPHDNHPPVTKTLTYRNDGAAPVTLDLSVQLDSGITAAPPTLGAGKLVVPAEGEATVDLTARFASDHIGQVAGAVTAVPAGGRDALVTTFGWYSAPEEYRLTLNLTGLDGQPIDGDVALDRVDGEHLPSAFRRTTGGKLTETVPPGRYAASAVVPQRATDTEPGKLVALALPEFTVSADTSVHLDGQRAKPVSVQVRGRADVRAAHTAMNYVRQGTDGWSASGFAIEAGPSWQLFASPTEKPRTGSAEFSLGGRHEVPPYRLRYADGTRAEIPVAPVDHSPRVDLDRSMVAADAGTAAPDELGDLRGKLAVIRRTDDRSAEEQVKAADSAGAAATMLYTPQVPGLLRDFVEPGTTSRPVLATSRAAAAELLGRIAAGAVGVRLTGVRWSPVTYDLLRPWPDAIPSAPVLHPGHQEFAEIDTVIGTHGDRTGQTLIQEGRLGRTPLGASSVGGPLTPHAMVPAPARRTSYVLGGPVDWSVLLLESGLWQGNSLRWIDWYSTFRRYQPGQRSRERWFTPVAVTGLRDDGPIIPAVERRGTWMSVALSPFTHSGLYETSYVPWGGPGTYAMRFSRNGQLVGTAEAPIEGFEIQPGAADFRIELDAQRDLPWWRHSTRVRSVWDFHSEDGEYVLPPLLAAGLTVPQADVLNRVATGKPTAIGLTLHHQSGSRASDITSATLELSYDGTTWTRLPLRQTRPGRYLANVNHPADRAGNAPSLRVTATDAAGGKLTQEVSRAYTLVAP